MGSCVAALLCGQLRGTDGAELELVAVSTDGELRGYLPHHEELVADAGADVSMQQRMLIDLAQKKQQLVYELASYQAAGSGAGTAAAVTAAAGSPGSIAAGLSALGRDFSSLTAGGMLAGLSGAAGSMGSAAGADRGHLAAMIPPDTCVDSAITVNKVSQMCELVLKTNNSTVIHAALIFGEQVRAS